MSKQLLTIKEAAYLLNISIPTLRRMVYSGQIGYVNMNPGGAYIMARFTPQHIEDFLRRHGCAAGR